MTTRIDYRGMKIRLILRRAKDTTIPDAGLTRHEFIARIMTKHPDGATPTHFKDMPGYHELNANICKMRKAGFDIRSERIRGKSYHRYWFDPAWRREIIGQRTLFG